MSIIVNLDVMMAKRKCRLKELAEAIGITEANLSILKNGKAKAIRFATLDAICTYLDCQPGDILEYQVEQQDDSAEQSDQLPLLLTGDG
ncbi:XRE family transcriptional regulator [Legionella steigerwaltii]|uniref:XRE family transcriptional regulator n=1 Tax=Legionella steigerwaltii TaxID=460 RepID=A0A378L4C5_9GAMM|nr:helix-turn-helix transcriptional regulator [Legionella steigerwaltii]KTD70941.1 XRE family transcriptional regulator [Legionella steigerwaltii]STY21537.1 XRE family transcriptional regulator [Legionella steigerwaltii]